MNKSELLLVVVIVGTLLSGCALPVIGRAATWLTGQSYHFVFDPIMDAGYVAEMVESFELLAL